MWFIRNISVNLTLVASRTHHVFPWHSIHFCFRKMGRMTARQVPCPGTEDVWCLPLGSVTLKGELHLHFTVARFLVKPPCKFSPGNLWGTYWVVFLMSLLCFSCFIEIPNTV